MIGSLSVDLHQTLMRKPRLPPLDNPRLSRIDSRRFSVPRLLMRDGNLRRDAWWIARVCSAADSQTESYCSSSYCCASNRTDPYPQRLRPERSRPIPARWSAIDFVRSRSAIEYRRELCYASYMMSTLAHSRVIFAHDITLRSRR